MQSFLLLSTFLTAVLAGILDRRDPCVATEYSQIATAVASCTNTALQNIAAPSNSAIDLSKVKANSTVTFAGLTTFGFTNSSSFDPITFGGKNVTITSAPGAIIDGNGQAYWDGLGSNGGASKSAPNPFAKSCN
jgi:polygalacturonase